MTILLLFLSPIVSRITEKLCGFVKYPVALGNVEILRGRLRGKTRADL